MQWENKKKVDLVWVSGHAYINCTEEEKHPLYYQIIFYSFK